LLGNNPKTIHQHLPRALGGENLASIMKNDGWFAGAGPGMLALIERCDPLLGLHGHLDQPHVVFFAKRVKRQHCCQQGL